MEQFASHKGAIAVAIIGILGAIGIGNYAMSKGKEPEKVPTAAEKRAAKMAECQITGYQSGSPAVSATTAGANTIIRFAAPPQKSLGLLALENGQKKRLEYLYGVYGPDTLVLNGQTYPWPLNLEVDGKWTILIPEAKCEEG